MKATKLFGLGLMALTFVGGMNVTGAMADERVAQPSLGQVRDGGGEEALIVGSIVPPLGVDVYRLQCAGLSVCASADVRDTGPFNDVNFHVTVIGAAPGTIVGKAAARTSPQGGLSAPATLCRPGAGSLTTYVVIDEANDKGPENYDSLMLCTNGPTVKPHTVTQTQNQ
jgi:hypothetical protein